ncbi:MAG: glutaredoxin [Patescibacteria group bacterium]|jgi:cytochrome c biogenesis protein CcdA
MLRKITFFFLSFFILAPLAFAVTPVNVFVREGCGHCADEEKFLTELAQTRNDFEVFYHDIGEVEHRAHFDALTALEKLPKATPITLVGNTIIQGFSSSETTGARISEILNAAAGKETLDFEQFIAAGGSSKVEKVGEGICQDTGEVCAAPEEKLIVDVPFVGTVDVGKYSLPTMAVVLGFVDGFNPCAMWVLVTFLIVLLQIGDRRKMFEVAGIFIFAEAVMYYAILNVWFTTWDFVGLDRFVTPIIGAVAICGAIFFLWEGFTSDGTCKVTSPEKRAKISNQIRSLASKPMTWAVAAGVLLLAFSVNIIEFACSIGIPQAFTKILQINSLSFLHRQFLLAIYIFFYVVDDLIVFAIALAGIEKLGITHKYSKISNIIGGVLMLILGSLLIFAPELLEFA